LFFQKMNEIKTQLSSTNIYGPLKTRKLIITLSGGRPKTSEIIQQKN